MTYHTFKKIMTASAAAAVFILTVLFIVFFAARACAIEPPVQKQWFLVNISLVAVTGTAQGSMGTPQNPFNVALAPGAAGNTVIAYAYDASGNPLFVALNPGYVIASPVYTTLTSDGSGNTTDIHVQAALTGWPHDIRNAILNPVIDDIPHSLLEHGNGYHVSISDTASTTPKYYEVVIKAGTHAHITPNIQTNGAIIAQLYLNTQSAATNDTITASCSNTFEPTTPTTKTYGTPITTTAGALYDTVLSNANGAAGTLNFGAREIVVGSQNADYKLYFKIYTTSSTALYTLKVDWYEQIGVAP